MRHGAVLPALILAAATGCAARRGSEVRYAPDVRGYVIGEPGPVPSALGVRMRITEPNETLRVLVRDPITGQKLRCREQIEPYLPPVTREIATLLHDERAALATVLPASVPLLPLLAPAPFLDVFGGMLVSTPFGYELLFSSPLADGLYRGGKRAFDERRFPDAERLFERALAKRRGSIDVQRSAYYLGILYAQEGRPADAARALRTFVERSDVRDEKVYDDAERRLAAIDPTAIAPCRSQETIAFAWPQHR